MREFEILSFGLAYCAFTSVFPVIQVVDLCDIHEKTVECFQENFKFVVVENTFFFGLEVCALAYRPVPFEDFVSQEEFCVAYMEKRQRGLVYMEIRLQGSIRLCDVLWL